MNGYQFKMKRIHKFKRKTKETQIEGQINVDGKGLFSIQTGIGFLDHMLEQLAFHSKMNIELTCKGDLHICQHHSIEDISIALGKGFDLALGDRIGIKRYASFYLPMDECLTRTSIDISGRAFHVFKGTFGTSMIGTFPAEMVRHFFYSFCMNAKITLHQEILYAENDHHRIESLFKGLAKSIFEAVQLLGETNEVQSTKGSL